MSYSQMPYGQSPYATQNHDDPNMAVPRPFRSSSANSSMHSGEDLVNGSHGTHPGYSPYANSSGSTPSLPRYQSQQQLPPNPSPLGPSSRPPYATTPGSNSPSTRFSPYGYQNSGGAQGGQSAHPLSNAMYMDSTPTLAGSMTPSEEKMRLGAADSLGEYIAPSTAGHTRGQGPASAVQPHASPAPYRRGPLKATGLTALYRAWSGATLADSGKDERHIKLPRLGYLDGIKFIAAWIVLNGTFFSATISSHDYAFIQRNSPLYITRSTGLGITFLLLLSGRSLVTPLWDVPSPSSGSKSKGALISWARLTRAMMIRPFRFILPVCSIVALQWGLSSSGRTHNCNKVGMDEPYWGLVGSFAGYATLVFNLFTTYESNTLAGKTFGANLFTSPWFFQSSYAVYVTHMMLGNLSSNRYWIYALLGLFSWTTFNYFAIAIIGLVFADMHAHGHLHRIRTKWSTTGRLALHVTLIAIACVTQFVPILRDNINKGMATINVQNHPELTFCDTVFATCWLFAIETSGLAQNILGNMVMRTFGKASAGMYLLAPAITYTIVPDLALNMHNNGSSASSVLGVSWLVLFIVTVILSVLFHFVVELPSKMFGEVVAELLEGEGESEIPGFGGQPRPVGGKLVKKHPGGPAASQAQPASRQVLQSKPAA
ncbi:hypothetical protein MVLG_00037 [Microbotryum lychnidis-dioicae p1A1 Lamole]|uniref:Acyltransferase 3 domain-containing protein n=1 Tax=Microbotryum lychnidis-dioicae (strain p1A1 Lamole / MvSl-1064) TaxID=683840 RepID=U5GXW1_USTV1|nr:hypothetical protein MVLG_00037 [Microbotryum lychnidis-dioicae p1A1 Lamole]|eukprot:KDE09630.1 hypothetical protein MVLG_00037 [Microbotryum lychnidis-dioicae p1A1 Lamole]